MTRAFQWCIVGLKRIKTHVERGIARLDEIMIFRLSRAPRAGDSTVAVWQSAIRKSRKIEVRKFSRKKRFLLTVTSGVQWRPQKN